MPLALSWYFIFKVTTDDRAEVERGLSSQDTIGMSMFSISFTSLILFDVQF